MNEDQNVNVVEELSQEITEEMPVPCTTLSLQPKSSSMESELHCS